MMGTNGEMREIVIGPEVEEEIARRLKAAMRDELKEEVHATVHGMRHQMEQEISASTSEAICALNFRLAASEKQHHDALNQLAGEIRLLRVGEPEVVEEPPAEEPPGEAPAEEPAEEEKPEEEPSEELEPIVGHCANCSVGFSEQDKAAGFKKCPNCGRDIDWD